jgi:hypothetical protein
LRATRPDLVAAYDAASLEHQRTVQILKNGPYPGITAGRPDLYKAFAWRFLRELRDGATWGVVISAKLIEASGNKEWRLHAMEHTTFRDAIVLLNDKRWVFDIHEQTAILLLTLTIGTPAETIPFRGPYRSMDAYLAGIEKPPLPLAIDGLREGTESAAIPLLPDPAEAALYLKMRAHTPLYRSIPGTQVRGLREFNAHDDSDKWHSDKHRGDWPVYTGVSFDLWNPETGNYYGWISPRTAADGLLSRAANQRRTRRSAFYGQPATISTDITAHPASRPRIAWRDSTNRDNQRTILACLVPPRICMVHQAYYLFPSVPSPRAEAYLLGVMSSIPYDWFARRSIERHATIEFVNGSPMPPLQDANPIHQRIITLAATLAAVDDRYTDWAEKVGVPVGGAPQEAREDLLAELDALVALAYGLTEADLTGIFETFKTGWAYQPRLAAVLRHYEAWHASAQKETPAP